MAHTITLPKCKQQGSTSHVLARAITETWAKEFERVIKAGRFDEFARLFVEDTWIRDFLAVSWDFRTIPGRDNVRQYFESNRHSGISNIRPCERGDFQPSFKTPCAGLQWIETMFKFETRVGRGRGMLRLIMDPNDNHNMKWKCYLINFTLQELKGHEEKLGSGRPIGYANPADGSWQQRRERQRDFIDKDPVVLVVGAGEHSLDSDRAFFKMLKLNIDERPSRA
ncbi:hypothetical protein JDV02_004040 [Purpureocillium takamizusanense]|uniref:SnoaL-like domain-containing protein n=1 Tax=Purpureocillium takamizusanense TaxID=2060973 RepID=A0A9Q8V9G6_9HYPO|nr:uncharacterized protein JDV02_004040 [Purpureocillium takamizusanense]UNI17718.1 hypothetical protein JDV02_004040 [Purpureocillium takamizusanense]